MVLRVEELSSEAADPVDEDGLNELDQLQRDLQTDWNQIVVENDECQQTVEEVRRLETCIYNNKFMSLNHKSFTKSR